MYFVEEPGHAIRYPVAIGELDDQWEGVETITAKRENPRWFPSSEGANPF
jgi:lipoprotein-anchoring transpeptidase ErfK/SrfK